MTPRPRARASPAPSLPAFLSHPSGWPPAALPPASAPQRPCWRRLCVPGAGPRFSTRPSNASDRPSTPSQLPHSGVYASTHRGAAAADPSPYPKAREMVPAKVPVPGAYVDANSHHLPSVSDYEARYAESIADPSKFWGAIARDGFVWKDWENVKTPLLRANFTPTPGHPVSTSFAVGARTNIAYNCLDRHVKNGLGDRVALLSEPNNPEDARARVSLTYAALLERVKLFAAVLRRSGVAKGDVVTVYMPMVSELVIVMLACARIGAIHSVVFGGFSAESLAGRVRGAKSTCVVTCDAVYRGSKLIDLKGTVDRAVEICSRAEQDMEAVAISSVVVLERVGAEHAPVRMATGRDIWWHGAMDAAKQAGALEKDAVEWVDAEHPLFILYTSGSTGKPKGIQHSTGGYMVYTATTFKYTFNYHPDDVYFCTADCGWITGHSYVTYGPLLNAATQVVFEGVPNYPDAGRLWDITDRYNVAILYTAPTAIRALKRAGDEYVTKYSRQSLKILGSVGEPINPEAYMWYFDVVGNQSCPIVDTWWQTETAGFCLVPLPLPGLEMKPGSAMNPFFGIEPVLLNEQGEELQGPAQGYLCIKNPWPSTLRSIYGDHKRMEEVYFSRFPGYYMTGDGARRDEDGHLYLTGRVDDVLNVSGHRMGTAEVESALVLHPAVVEAAVVGVPHDVKGEDIYAYVTLVASEKPSPELLAELKTHVRKEIGPIATPGVIHWAAALPKTRSGKIMRRILRIIAKNGKTCTDGDFGDISTLADPSAVQLLVDSYGS